MAEFVLFAFIILTVLIFLLAYWRDRPNPPPPPPPRDRTLIIEWSVNNTNNMLSQGQLIIDGVNIRQLPNPAAGPHSGPSLRSVMAQTGTAYNELMFTSFPPTNPLSRQEAENTENPWIITRIEDEFHLVNASIGTPTRLVRIFAR
jgi:hypothetical protein